MKLVSMGLLLAISLIILMAGIVSAETGKVISEKNEFGGKTVEIITTATDKSSNEDGVSRRILYYDSNGKVVKCEFFHTDKYVNEKGSNRSIVYYDSNGE